MPEPAPRRMCGCTAWLVVFTRTESGWVCDSCGHSIPHKTPQATTNQGASE